MPIRYADDFIVLVTTADGDPERCRAAEQEKSALGEMLLAELGLSLSAEKTLVTPVTSAMRFLGHHLCVRPHPSDRHTVAHLLIPKDRSQRLRRSISGDLRSIDGGRNTGQSFAFAQPAAAWLG